MTVVVLEDAAADIEAGRQFYETREQGVGDYFVESILSDLGSLVLYGGIHPPTIWLSPDAVQALPIRHLLRARTRRGVCLCGFGHASRSALDSGRASEKRLTHNFSCATCYG